MGAITTMTDLFKIKMNGTFKYSIDTELRNSLEKGMWFTRSSVYVPVLLILLLVDIAGFFQITNQVIVSAPTLKGIIVVGFGVAFEVAPLYIGYAVCLRCYDLGAPIRNYILCFSASSTLLGIVANFFLRFFTLDTTAPNHSFTVALVMFLLPIITSLMNLVFGCLSFDPLLMELRRLAKKLYTLKSLNNQMVGLIAEYSADSDNKQLELYGAKVAYDDTIEELSLLQTQLKAYVQTCATSQSFMTDIGGRAI